MNFRQVHLDFHTSEHIENIGAEFSKDLFKKALTAGHINSVTVFSKCHHGWSYHPTKANVMHPNLKFDLLKAQIEAAHEIGVRTPVYLSAGFDEKDAVMHHDWLFKPMGDENFPDFSNAGYHLLCLNTEYLNKLLRQIEEVCQNYDADGIFLDIASVRPCVCDKCVNDMKNAGLDPENENDVLKFGETVYLNYAASVRNAIDKYKPGLPVFHNGGHIMRGRRDLVYVNTHLEIESLPTGGWGYDNFPISAAYAKNLPVEYLGMTGKFHTTWGEFGGFKHPNALRYETALCAANGAKCSIGDQLPPTGKPDMVTYELIGSAYAELEKKEPWLNNVSSVADVAILSYESTAQPGDVNVKSGGNTFDVGAARILLEGKYLFDVIDTQNDFSKYKVVILPDLIPYNKSLYQKLKAFTAQGGKILATGKSALNKDKNAFEFDFGVKYIGESEYNPNYMHPYGEYEFLKETDYVMYSQCEKVELLGGTEYAKVTEPYFNRTAQHFCSHRHAPCSGKYGGAGMVEGKDGIYISWQIFDDYAVNGSYICKRAVCYALDKLLGKNKTLCTSLPAQGIVTLMNQNNRKILHMLYVSPVKRGKNIEVVEDIIPLYNINVSLKLPQKPNRVYLAPQNVDVQFKYTDGAAVFVLDKLENHQMVVFE